MNQLSIFTDPATPYSSTPDPTIDLMVYLFTAFIVYMIFTLSQIARTRYIEEMGHPVARLLTKGVEYFFLLCSASFVPALISNQGAIYYGLDVILAGLLIREAIKADKIHRSEYLRHYNISKNKLTNRMIMNLIHHPMHSDN